MQNLEPISKISQPNLINQRNIHFSTGIKIALDKTRPEIYLLFSVYPYLKQTHISIWTMHAATCTHVGLDILTLGSLISMSYLYSL